jgi:hypothetical protein
MKGRYQTTDAYIAQMAEDVPEVDEEASIMDVGVAMGENGTVMIGDSGEISPIELRQMSELEQAVRDQTGPPAKTIAAHPDGYKESGPDGNEHRLSVAAIKRPLVTNQEAVFKRRKED